MLENIHWLGHASFRIDGDVTLYIDPWKLSPGSPPADLILITHEHHDHFSPEDIGRIRQPDTEIVTIASVAGGLTGKVHTVKAGDELTVMGVKLVVLQAYNKTKQFHPRAKGHVGFVIELGDRRIYVSGDTDAIPEMRGIKPDIAIIPVSGVYVMDPEEAVEAVALIEPGVVIPMHYGDIVGTEADAERFQALCPVPVTILQAESR